MIISLIFGQFLGTSRDNRKTLFERKLEIFSKIISRISNHNYIGKRTSTDLVEMFTPVRFFVGKNINNELREYYSFVSEYPSFKNIEKM